MAEYTTNYNLEKQQPNEYINIEGLNGNLDKIDEVVSNVATRVIGVETNGVKANGGNADTVNGHTVESNVPVNAKFTDTVYVHPSSHPASMITGLPTSLPANGGNADTVDGLHATSLVRTLTLNALTTAELNSTQITYHYELDISDGSTIGLPPAFWHIKYHRHTNSIGYGAQTAIALNAGNQMYYRTSNGLIWASWARVYDTGMILKSTAVPSSLADGAIWLQYE